MAGRPGPSAVMAGSGPDPLCSHGKMGGWPGLPPTPHPEPRAGSVRALHPGAQRPEPWPGRLISPFCNRQEPHFHPKSHCPFLTEASSTRRPQESCSAPMMLAASSPCNPGASAPPQVWGNQAQRPGAPWSRAWALEGREPQFLLRWEFSLPSPNTEPPGGGPGGHGASSESVAGISRFQAQRSCQRLP